MKQTYRLDRLYHQFLRHNGIDANKLHALVDALYQAGFIELMPNDAESPCSRYVETEKLTSRLFRNELFKIIQELK